MVSTDQSTNSAPGTAEKKDNTDGTNSVNEKVSSITAVTQCGTGLHTSGQVSLFTQQNFYHPQTVMKVNI